MMSEQPYGGANLVPTGTSDLALQASKNPLVTRGVADLATVSEALGLPVDYLALPLDHPLRRAYELGRRTMRDLRRFPTKLLAAKAKALEEPGASFGQKLYAQLLRDELRRRGEVTPTRLPGRGRETLRDGATDTGTQIPAE